jgi:hypothetical protein
MVRALEDLDVKTVRALWASVAPDLPQPETDEDALRSIHAARTAAASVEFKRRAYSHAWLLDHGLPSLLPDELKPKAERIFPVTVGAVGISVRASSPARAALGLVIRGAMENAVLDCFANGDRDPDLVKSRMLEARDEVDRKLV